MNYEIDKKGSLTMGQVLTLITLENKEIKEVVFEGKMYNGQGVGSPVNKTHVFKKNNKDVWLTDVKGITIDENKFKVTNVFGINGGYTMIGILKVTY